MKGQINFFTKSDVQGGDYCATNENLRHTLFDIKLLDMFCSFLSRSMKSY